ncbi:hypothetical protein H6777_00425 [Candidatus Nomurabacteria bacterium]|nr:hypothetical protein [Candidatus Nomurabacteria bacterium]
MKRVWYSYLVSISTNFYTSLGFIFGVSSALFVSLVSLPDIWTNLLSVQLGLLPAYIWQTFIQAVEHGEFLTLLTLGLIIFSLLSLRFRGKISPSPMQYA